MNRVGIAVAVVVLGALAYVKWDRDRPKVAPTPEPLKSVRYRGRWVTPSPFRGIQIQVPEEFMKQPPRDHMTGQRLYVGPEEDGSPSIQVFTGPPGKRRSLEAWSKFWTSKYGFSTPVRRTKVLDEGASSIAGVPCRWFVMEDIDQKRRSLVYQFSFVSENAEHFIRGHAPDDLFRVGGFRATMDRVRASARFIK